jgi:hypothetical protein
MKRLLDMFVQCWLVRTVIELAKRDHSGRGEREREREWRQESRGERKPKDKSVLDTLREGEGEGEGERIWEERLVWQSLDKEQVCGTHSAWQRGEMRWRECCEENFEPQRQRRYVDHSIPRGR